jgi:predicted RNase H-like nuclease
VRRFIAEHSSPSTFIAIDAPLIIRNVSGQRPCEKAVGKRYGSKEASCHTSNQRLYPAARSVALADELVVAGYVHAPVAGISDKRVLLEVYPHAALVALFDLPKSLKYKKGTLAQKCHGLQTLVACLRELAHATPMLRESAMLTDILERETAGFSGSELKVHEDRLDAIVCAYLAYYFWYWRSERCETFGDIDTGYITNPLLAPGGIVKKAS